MLRKASLRAPADDPRAEKLTRKERAHESGVGYPVPADPAEDAQGDHKGHGQVDGEKPLQGEPSHVAPPVAEREVEQKDDGGYDGKAHDVRVVYTRPRRFATRGLRVWGCYPLSAS